MRTLMIVALFAAGPAAAQLGAQQNAARLTFSNGPYEGGVGDRWTREALIERAGAWGRCVAAAAPDQSAAFDRSGIAAPALTPVFKACRREVGQLDGVLTTDIRRAAIRDALARR